MNRNENKNVIISKCMKVNWVSFGKLCTNFAPKVKQMWWIYRYCTQLLELIQFLRVQNPLSIYGKTKYVDSTVTLHKTHMGFLISVRCTVPSWQWCQCNKSFCMCISTVFFARVHNALCVMFYAQVLKNTQ